MKITLDATTLRQMNLFQNITNVSPIDCIDEDDTIIFVVNLEDLGKAIGKKGMNIKNLKSLFKKNIYIYGYVNDVQEFLKILIPDATQFDIKDNKVIAHVDNDKKAREIGPSGKNIKIKRKLLKRFFDIDDLKIR